MIRKAEIKDIGALIELRMNLLREVRNIQEISNIEMLKEATRQYFENNLNKEFFSWVIEIDNQIVACSGLNIFRKPPVIGNLSGCEGYIMNIYVLPKFRKRGFASMLMEEIIAYVKQTDCKKIKLDATIQGREVYKKLGFIEKDSAIELIWE